MPQYSWVSQEWSPNRLMGTFIADWVKPRLNALHD